MFLIYSDGGANDPAIAAATLKTNGIAIITIAYQSTVASSIPDLSNISSTGYNFTNLDDNVPLELLNAFCDSKDVPIDGFSL